MPTHEAKSLISLRFLNLFELFEPAAGHSPRRLRIFAFGLGQVAPSEKCAMRVNVHYGLDACRETR